MKWNPNVSKVLKTCTLIGSFPFEDHEVAVRAAMEHVSLPCWPQLPKFPQEGMLRQFSLGIPCFEPEKLLINTSLPEFEEEKLKFYEEYLEVTEGGKPLEESRFSLTEEEAKGFFEFLKAARDESHLVGLKGQVTGPFTLSVGLKTPDGKAAFYDEELRDIVTKTVALKARWQVKRLKEVNETVVIFFDEPALSGFGSSAFVGVSREDILSLLKEVSEAVHEEGGIVGVHVCANTDWSLLTESPIDIINFDAYDYSERFVSYGKELARFLERGAIAWGLVPTLKAEELKKESAESLLEKFQRLTERLSETSQLSKEKIVERSILSPSCGMGTLTEELAFKALKDLSELCEKAF